MENVHPDKAFRFKNGKAAHNLWELRREIKQMGDDEYKGHVNEEKNDFANWITFVLNDKALAEKITKSATKQDTMNILQQKIDSITSELGKSHVVNDFELIKDFLIGLVIGLIVGAIIGVFII